jgi:Zn-dependent protease
MANSYSIGSLFNIPVRVHVTLLIFLPLFALSFAPVEGPLGLFYGALGAIGLFASVALHEVGHSLVARAKGSRILEILLLPIGGMARLDRLPPRPADEIQTALAGPAVSLALGIAGWWYAPLVYAANPPLGLILHALGRINLMLVLFNLIPSFPMDGGRVFRAALTPRLGRLAATQLAAKVGRAFAWIFGALGSCPSSTTDRSTSPSSSSPSSSTSPPPPKPAKPRPKPPMPARARDSGAFQIPEADVHVSPPPYARPAPRPASKGLFDDLLDKWR